KAGALVAGTALSLLRADVVVAAPPLPLRGMEGIRLAAAATADAGNDPGQIAAAGSRRHQGTVAPRAHQPDRLRRTGGGRKLHRAQNLRGSARNRADARARVIGGQ